MAITSEVSRRRSLARLAASLLVVAAATVTWNRAAARDGRPIAEAPMQISTDGLTEQEYVQRQDEMNRWLMRELPAAALESPIRISPGREEIDAIERVPRSSTPLKIGLVKALTPGVEVFGLDRGPADHQPHRGPSGLARPTGDGGFVWALVVTSEEAGAIRLHIENLSLPDNAQLYVYSRSGEAFGPYSGDGPNRTGELWTTAVFGSESILQLRISPPATKADLRNVTFRVTEAGLILKSFAGGLRPVLEAPPDRPPKPPSFCGNASCIVDATCFNTGPAEPAKLAVAKMEWIQGAFIYTCTGGLIADNDPAPAAKNYFLTANHCVSKNNNAQNVDFYFRFATSSCNGTCPSNSGWPYKTTGSTVKVTGRKGDFTLLQLSSDPPAGSTFLGWTNAPVANTNGVDMWRISNPDFGPQVYSKHKVDTSAPTCGGWPRGERIYSRDQDVDPNTTGHQGATDGGSSGSPVVNGASQIVGQLSGACGFNVNNVCDPVSNATVDGAFAFYFSSVQPILNP